MGEKVQGIRSIICRYKIDRGKLRILEEMEKPRSLYMTNGEELRERMLVGGLCMAEGDKGEKKWNYNGTINKIL